MQARERIEALVGREPVVLFMKGTRHAPQCGFSARVVDILDELLPEYVTVDVLADHELRDEVKRYSEWPTLPQLYVGGRFVGGADIVGEMMSTGELSSLVGAPRELPAIEPEVAVTERALAAFRRYAESERPKVRLSIDRDFDATLDLAPPKTGDIVLEMPGLVLAMDRATARRADGVVVDFIESRGGFRIENPNAPPRVQRLSVEELAEWRRAGKPHLLLDVRTPDERSIASLSESELLGPDAEDMLEELDRATTLVFYCHHGVRSRAAAEHCVRMGFRDVHNVEGGIDAWSLRVDASVPRY